MGHISQKYISAQIAQQEKLNALNAKNTNGSKELAQVQASYKALTQAQRSYITAVKNGDTASQAYWQQAQSAATRKIESIESKVGSLNIEESVRTKILNVIQQARDAEQTYARNLENLNSSTSKLDDSLGRIASRLLQMATTMLRLSAPIHPDPANIHRQRIPTRYQICHLGCFAVFAQPLHTLPGYPLALFWRILKRDTVG